MNLEIKLRLVERIANLINHPTHHDNHESILFDLTSWHNIVMFSVFKNTNGSVHIEHSLFQVLNTYNICDYCIQIYASIKLIMICWNSNRHVTSVVGSSWTFPSKGDRTCTDSVKGLSLDNHCENPIETLYSLAYSISWWWANCT